MTLPLIELVGNVPRDGLPIPDDAAFADDLANPATVREALGSQRVASKILPCIDSRARYWRYYLFAAPGHGRKPDLGRLLFEVLRQTPNESRRGVGRLIYRSANEKWSKSLGRNLEEAYLTAYRTATNAFWNAYQVASPGFKVLHERAVKFRRSEQYDNFFPHVSPGVNAAIDRQLRKSFHKRLIAFRPSLGQALVNYRFDLDELAAHAPHEPQLLREDKHLILTYTVLKALYRIEEPAVPLDKHKNTGDISDEDLEFDEDMPENTDLRPLALSALQLLKNKLGDGLSKPLRMSILRHLDSALRQPGEYQPPFPVTPLDSSGRRRRVFAGLRLRPYRFLLKMTANP